MPEHSAAQVAKDKTGQEAAFRKALPSLSSIALNINLPDELLTIAVLSSVFCSYLERNYMPSLFFLSSFPRQVLSKGKSNAAAAA